MSGKTGLKEVIPSSGMLFQEIKLYPVLCKPRLLPLKSVTLERLEAMQREAQERVWEAERQEEQPPPVQAGPDSAAPDADAAADAPDVWQWRPEDQGEEEQSPQDYAEEDSVI